MAITKINKIGKANTADARSLFNSLRYIMNPEKTRNGELIGGNSGTEVKEAFEVMLETKKEYKKMDMRQGYHMIISFRPGEADEETAYKVLREFCEEYLGDQYDYVFAIHNDQEHMHGHIVFNSVSRTTGVKYHYNDGDWEKFIQPITDRVCEKYNLELLSYDPQNKKGVSYAEHFAEKEGRPTLTKVIRADIDQAIQAVDSYEAFLDEMKRKGYRIRDKKYLTFYAPGAERGRRDSKLGVGYRREAIQMRIKYKDYGRSPAAVISPHLLKSYDRGLQAFIPRELSSYQSAKIRLFFRTGHYWDEHALINVPSKDRRKLSQMQEREVRKAIFRIDRLYEECVYILQNEIREPKDLEKRLEQLKKEKRDGKDWKSCRKERVILERMIAEERMNRTGSSNKQKEKGKEISP